MLNKHFYTLPLILAFLVCSGCSGENRPPGLPALYPVTLTIMLDGQPLADALVFLHPEDQAIANWTVGSYTDAEGRAIIVTHGQFRGAPAGKFKVCVSKMEIPSSPAAQDAEVGHIGQMSVPVGGMPTPIRHVAPIFSNQETTPLEIEIVPQGRRMTEFTLEVHRPE